MYMFTMLSFSNAICFLPEYAMENNLNLLANDVDVAELAKRRPTIDCLRPCTRPK